MNTMMTTGTSLKNIVVWLVEDNVDYSETVKRVFWRDYAKIESFSCAEDALKCMHSGVIPDIILMDIHLPGMNGVKATEQIKRETPQVKILILTGSENDTTVLETLQHGADGYMLKVSTAEAIELAIDQCMHGGRPLDAFVTSAMIDMLSRSENHTEHEPLNVDEKEILRSISKGLPRQDISERLGISVHTIDFHIRSIFKKFKVHSQQAAIAIAIKNNII